MQVPGDEAKSVKKKKTANPAKVAKKKKTANSAKVEKKTTTNPAEVANQSAETAQSNLRLLEKYVVERYGDFFVIIFMKKDVGGPNLSSEECSVFHLPSQTWKHIRGPGVNIPDQMEMMKKDHFGYPLRFAKGGLPRPVDEHTWVDIIMLQRARAAKASGDFGHKLKKKNGTTPSRPAETMQERAKRIQAESEYQKKVKELIAKPYRGEWGGIGTERYGDFSIVRFHGGGCVIPNIKISVQHVPTGTWKQYNGDSCMQDQIEGLKQQSFGFPEGFGRGGPGISFEGYVLRRPHRPRAR